MRINSRVEKQKFLTENIKDIGSYALITYEDGFIEPIWITKYANWSEEGDWFLESPCELHKYGYDINNPKDLKFIKKNNYLIRDGNVYEIDSPQTPPFLPEILEDLTLISEEECLDWILTKIKNRKECN